MTFVGDELELLKVFLLGLFLGAFFTILFIRSNPMKRTRPVTFLNYRFHQLLPHLNNRANRKTIL